MDEFAYAARSPTAVAAADGQALEPPRDEGFKAYPLRASELTEKSMALTSHKEFLKTFFCEGYRAPGERLPLLAEREEAFARNEPFFFHCEPSYEGDKDLAFEVRPAISIYQKFVQMDVDEIQDEDLLSKPLFYCLKDVGKIFSVERPEGPVNMKSHFMTHLIGLNLGDNCYSEAGMDDRYLTLATCFTLFDAGIGVEKNQEVAACLSEKIPEHRRKDVFEPVFMRAIIEKETSLAAACLRFGIAAGSTDDDGHIALTSCLYDGGESLLRSLLETVGPSDQGLVAHAMDVARRSGLQRMLRILQDFCREHYM